MTSFLSLFFPFIPFSRKRISGGLFAFAHLILNALSIGSHLGIVKNILTGISDECVGFRGAPRGDRIRVIIQGIRFEGIEIPGLFGKMPQLLLLDRKPIRAKTIMIRPTPM